MTSYQYRKSHCGDKTIVRSSYLHNWISYTGKMTSLFWIRALEIECWNDVMIQKWSSVGVSLCYDDPANRSIIYDHGLWWSMIDQDMMTSSNGKIYRVTGPLCWEFTGPGEFPAQRPVTRSFDVFFDLRSNERLSKQPWGWWFETPSWSLWR